MTKRSVLLVLIILAAATLAFAQTTPAPKGGTATKATPSAAQKTMGGEKTTKTRAAHEAFVTEAAQGGLAEVELGKLATEKASDADVKSFGQRMVDDHGKVNDELKTLAGQKNITLPTETDKRHLALKDRLSKLSGAAFDKAYMRDMVTDHRKDVAAFQREAKTGKDADVKAFAEKTLPTLQDHLKMAESTLKKVEGVGAATAKKPTAKKPGPKTR